MCQRIKGGEDVFLNARWIYRRWIRKEEMKREERVWKKMKNKKKKKKSENEEGEPFLLSMLSEIASVDMSLGSNPT